ncbi:hypothetical protein MTO96_031097 [Rhipicephalus appendiculatus]
MAEPPARCVHVLPVRLGCRRRIPFRKGYGMNHYGARRKNATRETTSTLKIWLNEHRKNPYPAKDEKIMVTIITKMTLTQDGQGSAAASQQENSTSSSEAAARAAKELARRNHQLMVAADGTAGLSESRKRPRDESDDLVDVDDDSRSSDQTDLRRPTWRSHSSEEPRHGLQQGGGNLSDASLSDSDSSARTPAVSKPRIWPILDTATSGSPSHSMMSPETPSAAVVAARMASLQRSDATRLPVPVPQDELVVRKYIGQPGCRPALPSRTRRPRH